MSRFVRVAARAGSYFLSSYSRTTDYLWIAVGTPGRLDESVSDEVLGLSIRDALDASQDGVARPDDLRGLLKPLLEVAGMRSEAAFYAGARVMAVERDGATVSVVPERWDGRSRRSPLFLPMEATMCDAPSSGDLGAAVREALNRAVPVPSSA